MKKDYTQINPVIAEAYDLIQKAAARTDGLSGSRADLRSWTR